MCIHVERQKGFFNVQQKETSFCSIDIRWFILSAKPALQVPAWFDLLKAGLLASIMVFQLAKKKVPRRVLRLKSFYLNLEIYACSLALHPLNDVARCARWSIHWQQDSSTKSSIQISETMGICSKNWKAIHAFLNSV